MHYLYLVIFALNWPDLTKCAIFTLDVYSYIETAYSVQNCRAIGQLFIDILRFKELGDTESDRQFCVCTF